MSVVLKTWTQELHPDSKGGRIIASSDHKSDVFNYTAYANILSTLIYGTKKMRQQIIDIN